MGSDALNSSQKGKSSRPLTSGSGPQRTFTPCIYANACHSNKSYTLIIRLL